MHELTTPSLLVDTRALMLEGRTLVRLDVPRGIDVHNADGRFTRRIGKSCERMSAREIVQLADERVRTDWNAEVTGDAANGLDLEAMLALRRLLADAERRDARTAHADDTDLLKR